jgi:hypothetical protein
MKQTGVVLCSDRRVETDADIGSLVCSTDLLPKCCPACIAKLCEHRGLRCGRSITRTCGVHADSFASDNDTRHHSLQPTLRDHTQHQHSQQHWILPLCAFCRFKDRVSRLKSTSSPVAAALAPDMPASAFAPCRTGRTQSMSNRAERSQCRTVQNTVNVEQSRTQSMSNRAEHSQCRTEQNTVNVEQSRTQSMSNRAEHSPCRTVQNTVKSKLSREGTRNPHRRRAPPCLGMQCPHSLGPKWTPLHLRTTRCPKTSVL